MISEFFITNSGFVITLYISSKILYKQFVFRGKCFRGI